MCTIVRQHLIERAIADMVRDLHQACGLSYSDWVDYSFNRGMLRTIASVDVKVNNPHHLPACLRCRCGNCRENLDIRDRCFAWSPSFPSGERQPDTREVRLSEHRLVSCTDYARCVHVWPSPVYRGAAYLWQVCPHYSRM